MLRDDSTLLPRLHAAGWRDGINLGRRLCAARRWLGVADIVGRQAVETVGVPVLAGVNGGGFRSRRLPERERAVVVGDVHVEGGDAGAADIVRPGPTDKEVARAARRQTSSMCGFNPRFSCTTTMPPSFFFASTGFESKALMVPAPLGEG